MTDQDRARALLDAAGGPGFDVKQQEVTALRGIGYALLAVVDVIREGNKLHGQAELW